jgi:hypothetical protein
MLLPGVHCRICSEGKWHVEAREWRVHLKHYAALKALLEQHNFMIEDLSVHAKELVLKGFSMRCPRPKSQQVCFHRKPWSHAVPV